MKVGARDWRVFVNTFVLILAPFAMISLIYQLPALIPERAEAKWREGKRVKRQNMKSKDFKVALLSFHVLLSSRN